MQMHNDANMLATLTSRIWYAPFQLEYYINSYIMIILIFFLGVFVLQINSWKLQN
jgi:hypothetical protein